MKRTVLLCVLFLFCAKNVYAFGLSAKSAILTDADGRVLYEKNSDDVLSMASTTKIMTAYIALKYGNCDDTVTVPEEACGIEGTSMYLKAGEKITLRELLYGLMLSSGNDAAVAVAIHIGGSVQNFAKMMTDEAKKMGCTKTCFKNPNGLEEEGHQTTAHELALITGEALKNEEFKRIVSAQSYKGEHGTYKNHNKLLNMYNGVFGVKTGYTKKCGRSLVTACERNGFMLLCVTLNAPDDWNDHIKMYDYAYASYRFSEEVHKGDVCDRADTDNISLDCVYKDSLGFYLSDEEKASVQIKKDLKDITKDIRDGEKIGEAQVILNGRVLGKCDILAANVNKKNENGFKNALLSIFVMWLRAFR